MIELGVSQAVSFFWSQANRFTRWMIERGLLVPKKLSVPVVSIGNLVAGGSGKTELTAFLAHHYGEQNYKVAVLSRGYKLNLKGGSLVLTGDELQKASIELGDEVTVYAKKSPRVTLVLGRNRYENAQDFLKTEPIDLFLLDDGLQHHKLDRQIDLILHEFRSGKDFRIYRDFYESFQGLSSSEKFFLNFSSSSHGEFQLKNLKCRSHQTDEWISVGYGFSGFFDPRTKTNVDTKSLTLNGVRVLAGIALPERILQFLEQEQITVVDSLFFSDHCAYSHQELKKIQLWMNQGTAPVVTTWKDYQKLERHGLSFPVIEIKIKTSPEWARVTDAIDRLLQRKT